MSRVGLFFAGLILVLAATAPSLAQRWQPEYRDQSYTVSGLTGIELYRAIGEKGPKVGLTRAIGLTEWDLKWRRDYQTQDGGCRLVSVTPFLVITTTLPEASGSMPSGVKAKWDRFVAGIAVHEAIHAEFLVDLVNEKIAETEGLFVSGDTGCKAIRQEVQRRIFAAYDAFKDRNARFERGEMADGGPIRRLILDLIQ